MDFFFISSEKKSKFIGEKKLIRICFFFRKKNKFPNLVFFISEKKNKFDFVFFSSEYSFFLQKKSKFTGEKKINSIFFPEIKNEIFKFVFFFYFRKKT